MSIRQKYEKNQRLIDLRNKKGKSQTAVSTMVGISQEYYSGIENGNNRPSVGVLLELAKYFDCSTDYILGRSEVSTVADHIIIYNNLTVEEQIVLQKYRALNKEERLKFHENIDTI